MLKRHMDPDKAHMVGWALPSHLLEEQPPFLPSTHYDYISNVYQSKIFRIKINTHMAWLLFILFRTENPFLVSLTPAVNIRPKTTTATTTTAPSISIVSTSTYIRTTARPRFIKVSLPPFNLPSVPNIPQDIESVRSASPRFNHPKQHTGPTQGRNDQNRNPLSRYLK